MTYPVTNVDSGEIEKFDRISHIWWDPKGEMGTLHTINPLRTQFILEQLDHASPAPRILDVGCGGGILAEALAQRGARVTGIDLSEPSLQVARHHAQSQGLSIEYLYASAEQIAAERPGYFDAVTCMEMLEHVPEPSRVIAACAQALRHAGHAFFSTINRTPKAFLFAIIGAEYIFRLLPRGTHVYRMLIRPSELRQWGAQAGLRFVRSASLIFNPLTRRFRLVHGIEDVNYFMHFVKGGS